MKVKDIKKIKKYLTSVQKYLPTELSSKAISIVTGGSTLPSIPIFSTDSDVIEFINEYDLNKPDNLIKFIIEIYYENYEALQESIAQLKDMDMINTISAVSGAKKTYEMSKGVSDRERQLAHISSAQASLNKATSALEEKILYYIRAQRNIDGMNRFKRIIRSKSILIDIDTNNVLAKQAIRAIFEAVTLQTVIAKEIGDNIEKSVIIPYNNFKKKILENDNCLLMNDYDKDYEDEFWLHIADLLESVNTASEIIQEVSDEPDDEDIDYENIEF